MPPLTDCVNSAATHASDGVRLARQLRRLLARGCLGPTVLWLRDGRHLEVPEARSLRVHRDEGTITVARPDGVHQILLEDLLAIELRPHAAPRHGPES